MNENTKHLLPVDEVKVIDLVIDVYLWVSEYLNTNEVRLLGERLIALADRRATDVEAIYYANRQLSHEAGIGYMEEPDYARHEPV